MMEGCKEAGIPCFGTLFDFCKSWWLLSELVFTGDLQSRGAFLCVQTLILYLGLFLELTPIFLYLLAAVQPSVMGFCSSYYSLCINHMLYRCAGQPCSITL